MSGGEDFPELGETLPAASPSAETLSLLRRRRSTPADFLDAPGPDAQTLRDLLTIAARVPDHRRVAPFRFLIFENGAREKFGAVLKDAFLKQDPAAEPKKADYEAARFMRAPVVVAVISSVNPGHRTPEWEQVLCVGAVCQNLLIAASASGFAAQWLTEWYAYDNNVTAALGLGENERIAGFVYIGVAREDPKERGRPDMASLMAHYDG